MASYVKAIIYTAVAVWAVVLLIGGPKLSADLLRPVSAVTSIVVLLSIAFELWLWKLPVLRGWLVKRPVIEGTWRAELSSNWQDAGGAAIPPVRGYVVIRQSLLNLSLRLLTEESSSHLVGTEIVCTVDGLYCVSGVYRNEPNYRERGPSPIPLGRGLASGHSVARTDAAGTLLDRPQYGRRDAPDGQAQGEVPGLRVSSGALRAVISLHAQLSAFAEMG